VVDDEGPPRTRATSPSPAERSRRRFINSLATHGRGLVCLGLTGERCDQMRLPLMSPLNTSNFGTAFCERSMPVRASPPASPPPTALHHSQGRSTQRAVRAIWRAPATFSRCARARAACCVRAGQTEASVDLARMARLSARPVDLQIMNPDGTMARVPQLKEFCIATGSR